MQFNKKSFDQPQYLLPIHDAVIQKLEIDPAKRSISIRIHNEWTGKNEAIECKNYRVISTTAIVMGGPKNENERVYGAIIKNCHSDDAMPDYSIGYIDMGSPYHIDQDECLSLLINWMSGDYVHILCEEVQYNAIV